MSPDVIQYIKKSLTKTEIKKNTVGRKARNYPKRSKIIKIDPVRDLPEISEKEKIIESNFKHVSFDLDDYARGIKPKLMYHCSKCDKKYESTLLLNKHSKIDHEKISLFCCSKCPNFYEKENSLKNHISLMHWSSGKHV